MHIKETRTANQGASPASESEESTREGKRNGSRQLASSPPHPLTFQQMMHFQRTVGNQLLNKWLGTAATIQRTSTVVQRSTKDVTINLGNDAPTTLTTSTDDEEQQDRDIVEQQDNEKEKETVNANLILDHLAALRSQKN